MTVPAFVTATDHVQLAMPAGREDDARRFYSGLLGLPSRRAGRDRDSA